MASQEPLAVVAPLVLPLDAAGTAYEGYLSSSAHRRAAASARPASLWLRLSGLEPGSLTLRGARLEVNAELGALLEGREEVLAHRLAESASLPAFVLELQNMVEHASLERAPPPSCRPPAFYSSLRAELDEIGWRHISSLADDLSHLTLQASDVAGRRHELRLSFPPAYPAAAPAASADLPAPFELRWLPVGGGGGGGACLSAVLRQFEAALAQHQQLWDSLDDLDANAWVIEPTNAPRSAVYRRVALGSHVSLALTLDPAHPGQLPLDCRFMGSDRAVAPLRQQVHDNRGRWQEGRPLRENLEAVLELELPQRGQGPGAEDASADCAICYSYRLPAAEEGAQGEAPTINCDNANCGKPFHRRCLVEWLNADTSTRQSFSTLFGACPYCSAPVTVKVS